ncbi:receptor-like protein kinase HERK 1 [Rutidosis leptorrhynchoides]|uniref:receptor-like protein kinase HERK 1 n=1 Tax=Rutidosis leptorrhynchoides TaxID=125765 RepID=UPI003A99969E
MEPTFTEFAHLKIPLEEIQEATNNFAEKNIIGKGGFGIVYKGKINRSGKSIKIVAQRLGRNQWQGDVEFWTEISMLSTIKHDNIVSLIGYCDEKGDKIIINRLYAKGSLVRYLSDPTTLSWFHRLKICFHVACAIRHIHNNLYESYYIIHRNINSSTIVLDHNFDDGGVRLSGFEHSIKHSVDRKDQVYIGEAIGTQGYMDPAIETTKGVNHKSDIYSFGVVLFEMLCGRKAFQDNKLLAPLAKNHYENGTLSEIIHPDLWNQMNPESFKFFSEVAYSCLHEDPTQRPDVAELTNILYMAYIVHFDHPTHDKVKEDNESMDECLVSEGDKMFESFTPSEVDKMLESLQPCTNKWWILNTIVEGANLEHNFLKVNHEHIIYNTMNIYINQIGYLISYRTNI